MNFEKYAFPWPQRRYIRNGGCTENLYDGFRSWVSVCEQDLDWAAVMDQDRHACAEQSERGETIIPGDHA